MPVPHTNGQPTDETSNPSASPERWGLAEVIAETEALRGLLHGAASRTNRLLAALKQQKRQIRAVQQAVESFASAPAGSVSISPSVP